MSYRSEIAAALVVGMVLGASLQADAVEAQELNDTARFLAGMPLGAGSSLQALAQDGPSRQHASAFDSAFDNHETQHLGKIREWSKAYLGVSQPTVFYFFSGPDFLYPDAFFPNATTYVLSGLEAVGKVPDLTESRGDVIAQTLNNIEVSLSTVFFASYFITAKMDTDLNNGPVNGVLPLLLVFLARSGKVIHDMGFVNLDSNGNPQPIDRPRGKNAARGVRIAFVAANGQVKTLYYFSVDVADKSNGSYALRQFCRQFGRGDSLLKSASYLLHETKFSRVKNFLLEYSSVIVQDDSGIPVTSFDRRGWQLFAFGRYDRPSGVFEKYYQPKLTEMFQQHAGPLGFGIGYQARFDGSNVLLATKIATGADSARLDSRSRAPH